MEHKANQGLTNFKVKIKEYPSKLFAAKMKVNDEKAEELCERNIL